MAEIAAIIAAGGVGTRLGRRTPKQFLTIGGEPVLVTTVRHFARHPRVGKVVVAVPAVHLARARRLVASLAAGGKVTVVAGGAARQDSVRLSLEALGDEAGIVVVHDAVRPFVTRGLIDAVVEAARATGAAICGLPVVETVKRVRGDLVAATVDREGLWTVQTPQAFLAGLLREAHERARRDGVVGTDDAMLVERLGHRVRMVRGLEANIKITTPNDLRRARRRGRG